MTHPDLPDLSAAEQRVLGSLLEKEVTVPSTYPMTVNAIRTACNQTSSREPVVDYDEREVHDVLRELKTKDLVATTWEDRGRRTLKYVQRLDVVLGLEPDERALLTVLLLRGAQPPGALRTRTERLHPFADRDAVAACLARMAARPAPLVRELPRGAREQDSRWVHLLGAVEAPSADATTTTTTTTASSIAAREAVLADGPAARDTRVRTSYAAVAAAYADALTGEFQALPFERWLLDRVAAHAVESGAPLVEVGCGPGHVTAHLDAAGAEAVGLDFVPEMVEQARERFPGPRYEVGDLRQLMRPAGAEGWAGVLAWYSLIHTAPSELPEAVGALVRPLAPGGWLVVAAHCGLDAREHRSWFDLDVDLTLLGHEPAELVALFEGAGLVDVEWYRRGPRRDRDETTERCYVLGRRPA